VVVDGNGGAGSLLPLLCSGALVFKATLMPLWYHFRLRPWEHYVPVK